MTGRILHGADEVLQGVLWDLGQIGDEDGSKYPEAVLRRLAAKILEGRAHEPLVFRLCHLARAAAFAAEGGGMGWLEFFCAPGAGRAGWAAGWFYARLPAEGSGSSEGSPVTAGAAEVALRYRSRAEPVTVSFGAMPLLAAFMEFLLNTLPFDALGAAASSLSRPDLGWRELQDTANALSRSVYAWLREHTRPVQDSRQFDVMARFLAERGGGGDFAIEDIDDAAVLAFWRVASLEPETEFRTFRKTFRTFLRLAEALREDAWREGVEEPDALGGAMERAGREPADPSSPGLDRMRAPWSAGNSWEAPADGEDAPSPLEVLAGSEIKFLLASEVKRLTLVDAHGPFLPPLVHSFLRDVCFGQAQGRISQGLRANPEAVAALTAAPPETGYDQETESLGALLSQLDDLMLATAAALALVEEGGETVRRLDFETLGRGGRVLKGLRRRGFDRVRAGDPEALNDLRRTIPAMVELRQRLAPVCARLREGAPWRTLQQEDEDVFAEQFARIYGITDAREGEAVS